MQQNIFIGNLTQAPTLEKTSSGIAICKFMLIENEYIGKNEESGEKIEKKTSIYFTAFNHAAEYIHKYAMIGDQLIVSHIIENNSYMDEGTGERIFKKDNHIVLKIQIGAPGKLKKEKNDATHLKNFNK